MQFIGNIEGYNYNPITNYNAFLKGNATFNQKVEVPSETEFDKALNIAKIKTEPAPDTAGGMMKQLENAVSATLNDVNNKRLLADA